MSSGTATLNNTVQSVPANMARMYPPSSSEDDVVSSSGGSTPILSDGDTSSDGVKIVAEPIQQKHGVIFENVQKEADLSKRDTPLPAASKKSKYDANLDFAANQPQAVIRHVSESESAELDPLD
jgi:hypothetical protein